MSYRSMAMREYEVGAEEKALVPMLKEWGVCRGRTT